MAIGLSIHIGLNEIDARHYGSPCTLRGCEGDAHAMRKLAADAGFEPIAMMLGPAAKAQAVLDAIRGAAPRIGGDGMLLVTYSGHGGQVRDVSGDEGGEGSWDETWCLHDRELVDDELKDCWPDFARGARVLVVSDSCFSGDMIRIADPARAPREPDAPGGLGEPPRPLAGRRQLVLWNAKPVGEGAIHGADDALEPPGGGVPVLRQASVTRGGRPAMRALSSRRARKVYNRHYRMYDQIQLEVAARPQRPIEAQVLLLAAAQDIEPAQDGDENGAYTAALLQVWNGGAFEGSYIDLHNEIYRRLVPHQHPALLALVPPAFAHDRPFAI